jgi:uncharacterized membrane protein YbhN (UPF0104 family)
MAGERLATTTRLPPGGPTEGTTSMGYGLGIFLLALGLILALAVQDTISNIDLTLIGWILALAGVLVIVLTAVTLNRGRASRTVATTTHPDGSQTTTEQRHRNDPPPTV